MLSLLAPAPRICPHTLLFRIFSRLPRHLPPARLRDDLLGDSATRSARSICAAVFCSLAPDPGTPRHGGCCQEGGLRRSTAACVLRARARVASSLVGVGWVWRWWRRRFYCGGWACGGLAETSSAAGALLGAFEHADSDGVLRLSRKSSTLTWSGAVPPGTVVLRWLSAAVRSALSTRTM